MLSMRGKVEFEEVEEIEVEEVEVEEVEDFFLF
jgi:hypothetical protein